MSSCLMQRILNRSIAVWMELIYRSASTGIYSVDHRFFLNGSPFLVLFFWQKQLIEVAHQLYSQFFLLSVIFD